MRLMKNQAIAEIFEDIADMLEFLGDNPFRVRAYRQAARVLYDLEDPIEEIAKGGVEALEEIPGIGHDLALKILEYLKTGKVKKHEELKQKVPKGVLEVMRVPGVGPKTTKLLYEELGVDSLEKLRAALESGEVLKLPGWGEKKRERILKNLNLVEAASKRHLLGAVLYAARELLEGLRALPEVEAAEIAGSARRYKETVGDLDFLAATTEGAKVAKAFTKLAPVEEVYALGSNRATVYIRGGVQVDLKIVPPESWGAGLQYFTGSKAHDIHLRKIAQSMGLKLNEYGVWRGGERIAGRTEEEVYAALGMDWIPPPMREDLGEIELAQKHALPRLVKLEEIRGDPQVHSKWSDGKHTLEELARFAAEHGYEYLAVTDHSPAVRVAGGVPPEKMKERLAEIRRVNEKTGGKPYLIAGAEVDILADGTLDYPDEILKELEFVLVSIHSRFSMDEEAMTKRILRAIENPYVHVFAHPTARLIGKREPVKADWEKIFAHMKALGKAVEIDCYYDRLDLPDVLARRARELGLTFSLSTDAHHKDHLRFMELAVGTAQRAWIGPEQVLNTRPLDELLNWAREVRKA